MNLSIFTAFLKNKNIIFKIRRSKVTEYAALSYHLSIRSLFCLFLSHARTQEFSSGGVQLNLTKKALRTFFLFLFLSSAYFTEVKWLISK